MSMTIMNLAEYAAECERTACARCFCRTGRFPTQAEANAELALMRTETAKGNNLLPEPKIVEVAQWLRDRSVPIPGRDAAAARALPTSTPKEPEARPAPAPFKAQVLQATESKPVAVAKPKIELPTYQASECGTIVGRLEAVEAHIEKLEAVARQAGVTPPQYRAKTNGSIYSRVVYADAHIPKIERAIKAAVA